MAENFTYDAYYGKRNLGQIPQSLAQKSFNQSYEANLPRATSTQSNGIGDKVKNFFKGSDTGNGENGFFKGGENSTFAGLTSGANAIGSLIGLGFNMSIADKQMRRAKEANELARKQFETENKRYNEQKAELNASRESSANSAANFASNNVNPQSARGNAQSEPTPQGQPQGNDQAQPQKELPMEKE